jgi:ribosomal protein S18 acetylase RimI-like enzyme
MTNLERMIALADKFFGAKNDPEQLAVDEQVMRKLKELHPATLGELTEGDGPVAWLLVVPTTRLLMERFLMKEIGERALLRLTDPRGPFDALYLCSALVLPEYRGKGVAKNLTMQAIRAIQRDHPIEQLFYWAFSVEGTRLAQTVAGEAGLPLFRRED